MPTRQISSFEIARMINQINRLEKRSRVDMMISEEAAAELLNISVGHLTKLVRQGKMEGVYTVGATGARFYNKAKLLGVED